MKLRAVTHWSYIQHISEALWAWLGTKRYTWANLCQWRVDETWLLSNIWVNYSLANCRCLCVVLHSREIPLHIFQYPIHSQWNQKCKRRFYFVSIILNADDMYENSNLVTCQLLQVLLEDLQLHKTSFYLQLIFHSKTIAAQ